ncbi:TraG family conjugative transposon ATPase [Flavobacteriaceae bacterium]|nr:TraG family conjugative transposon ATPase [Flavobacteriaceae bacterium]
MNSFKKKIPILEITDDKIIAKSGDISMVYQLELPQIYSINLDDYQTISSILQRVIFQFPIGTVIQKQDIFLQDSIKEKINDSNEFLPRSDNAFYHESPLITHFCYLTLTTLNSLTEKQELKEKRILEFEKITHAAMEELDQSSFFNAKKLNNVQISNYIEQYFKLGKQDECQFEIYDADNFKVNNNFVQAYCMGSNHSLPLSVSHAKKDDYLSSDRTDFFVPYINHLGISLRGNHVYNQIIYIEDNESLKKMIELKSKNFKGLQSLSRFNRISYEFLEDYLDEAETNNIKFIKMNCNLFVWHEEFDKFNDLKSKTEKAFQKLEITPLKIDGQALDFFIENTPGNASKIKPYFRFIIPSNIFSIFLNLESTVIKNKSGIVFCDIINEEPLAVDLWDEPLKRGLIVNRNRLIFGPSGTGKSFLINHIVSQYFEQGHHIIMVDIGNSYKKLCLLVKGVYLEYEEDNPLTFNPFNIEDITIDKKEFLISLLLFLWKGDDVKPTREEKNILAQYIDLYYESRSNSDIMDFNSFYEFIKETSIKGSKVYFDKNSFLLATSEFYKGGSYGDILNSSDKADYLNNRFIVFELDNIKDHPILFPLVAMLLIETTMDKVRLLKGVKKSIFIDECWKPLSKGSMVSFIKYLYKTIRKFYGEVAIATQDIDDILATDAGAAMVNNTDTFLMLSHEKKLSLKDKFSKHLSFTNADVNKLYSTRKRQVFIKIGSVSNVYKLKVSPERYACYTSNGDENSAIFNTYEETENMEVSLKEFLE